MKIVLTIIEIVVLVVGGIACIILAIKNMKDYKAMFGEGMFFKRKHKE